MAVWLLSILISGCLAMPGMPSPRHPGQDLIDVALQSTQAESRIIGGTDALISQFPWQASLRGSSGSHTCGAIILNANFVLTAAHCTQSSASSYSVNVGSAYLNSGGSLHGVSAVKNHESFINGGNTPDGAFPYDVAVVKLSSPISFDLNKEPIDLTSETNDDLADKYDATDCYITGWGRTNGNGGSLPNRLQKTNVDILSDDSCRTYVGNGLNDPIHICVFGINNSGGCNGDSGGPLVCKVGGNFELAGVTSFVFGSCLTSYPTVYAETLAFKSWIQNAMNSM